MTSRAPNVHKLEKLIELLLEADKHQRLLEFLGGTEAKEYFYQPSEIETAHS